MKKSMRIRGIASVFGTHEISSEEIAEATGSPADFRKQKLGIDKIKVATSEECCSELATRAINKLFTEYSYINKNDIEFLILVTQNPDYRLPTTACIVQHKANLPNNILNYDINQGCSGFIVALAQAKALITSGMFKKGLIVTSESYNKIIDKSDRSTFGLFGDGAAATLVEACDNPEQGVQNFFFGSDGSGAQYLMLKAGGTVYPEKLNNAGDYLYMDGKSIFKFVVKTLPTHIKTFLSAQNLEIADIDQWILHQANKYMNAGLCEAVGIPTNKAFFDIYDIGNTVSSTIPITLERAIKAKSLTGKKIFLCGFGVGLSWGGCIYNLVEDNLL